jgi:hypothetical protein
MKGISMFLKMKGRDGMEINSRFPPHQWQLMLCCQAKGKEAKVLITSSLYPTITLIDIVREVMTNYGT